MRRPKRCAKRAISYLDSYRCDLVRYHNRDNHSTSLQFRERKKNNNLLLFASAQGYYADVSLSC